MNAHREEVSIPLWTTDQIDRTAPPLIEPPYFDKTLDAWVVTRYEDVLAALRSSSLNVESKVPRTAQDESALVTLREDTLQALSPTQLRKWSDAINPTIRERVESLPEGQPVDLLDEYLRPNCLDLASIATSIDPYDAVRLRELARPISAAAAEPYDPELRANAKSVTPELRACFHSKTETLRDSGFIALAHTLPCLLANACYALLENPQQWNLLHRQPELMEQALEELLRYAGLARFIRRQATEDLLLGGASIHQGDQLFLRIIAANHDPARFSQPNELDLRRREGGHLTLGAGSHACVGASLIRMAAIAIIRPLAEFFATAVLTEAVDWQGGSGFCFPKNLTVQLNKTRAR